MLSSFSTSRSSSRLDGLELDGRSTRSGDGRRRQHGAGDGGCGRGDGSLHGADQRRDRRGSDADVGRGVQRRRRRHRGGGGGGHRHDDRVARHGYGGCRRPVEGDALGEEAAGSGRGAGRGGLACGGGCCAAGAGAGRSGDGEQGGVGMT